MNRYYLRSIEVLREIKRHEIADDIADYVNYLTLSKNTKECELSALKEDKKILIELVRELELKVITIRQGE